MQELIEGAEDLQLIDRAEALQLIENEEQAQREHCRDSINLIKRTKAVGAQNALQKIRDRLAKLDPIDPQIYDYAEFTDHYRLVPCDDDVRCHHCGYKRPRLRGENIFFCSICGACFGLKED